MYLLDEILEVKLIKCQGLSRFTYFWIEYLFLDWFLGRVPDILLHQAERIHYWYNMLTPEPNKVIAVGFQFLEHKL